jgi:HD superfamily phosphohydrolase
LRHGSLRFEDFHDALFPAMTSRVTIGSHKIIRDPIHGFVKLSPWEQDVVDHRVFQRLRHIRQPGLTEMVYPGACHSRFEHSLGVMQVATMMFYQRRSQPTGVRRAKTLAFPA